MTPKPPTPRQLRYLRALANRTGQTFCYPTTTREASREIERLKAVRRSSPIELELERVDLAAEQAARDVSCDVPVNLDTEVIGYAATARWSRRS